MIIFDLDGTLADCEHRRHFVDSKKQTVKIGCTISLDLTTGKTYSDIPNFKPDWKAFYEACDQDKPIPSTIHLLNHLILLDNEIEIWSGRCESVKEKTQKWLYDYTFQNGQYPLVLKMRPIGDNTPDDILKERWLDEAIAKGKKIDFVFDDRPKVIRMYRSKGIFVFNCCQQEQEF